MKKRILIISFVLTLAVVLLSGCTPNGNKYLALEKEMALLTQYSYSEDLSLSYNFPASITETMTAEEKDLLEKLEDIQMTVSGSYISQGMYQDFKLDFQLGDGTEGSLRGIVSGPDFYLNTDDLVTLLKTFVPATEMHEVNAFETAVKDIDWLKISSAGESLEILGSDSSLINTQEIATEYVEAYYDYIDYLNANSFAAYKPDIFSASGGKYTMNITEEKFIPAITGFVDYLIRNRADVIQDTRDFIAGLDSGLFTSLEIEQEEVLEALDELAVASESLTQDDIDYFTNMLDLYLPIIDGSSYKCSLEKTGTGKYRNNIDLNLVITYGDTISMRLKGTTDIDSTATVTPQVPTTGVKTIDELAASQQPSYYLTVYAATGDVVWEKSYDCSLFDDSGSTSITLKNINGSYYLPLRQVGELCGENVQWDAAMKKAYAISNGQKIYLTGIADNGRIYVKLRELEKLGYVVTWDGLAKEITIAN